MKTNRTHSGAARFFKAVAGALNAAAAMRAGVNPSNRDLDALGIDARDFREIRRG